MNIIVGCEFSGAVRDAFRACGHDAVSCDLLPTERPGPHIQGDLLEAMRARRWDMGIFFPPCTHLAVSGARWFIEKQNVQPQAVEFFMACIDAPIDRVVVENPIGIMSTCYRKPDQIIQPWMFGCAETKATCLWLKGVPPLVATHAEQPDLFLLPAPLERTPRIWLEPPSDSRWKNRSRTYDPIAQAMADQWGTLARRAAA